MHSPKIRPTRHPLRLLAVTIAVALAAGIAQTAGAQPHPGGPGMGMEMADGHRIAHMLDAVGASADQRARIQQIVQAAHTDLKALRQAGRALQQQSQALFAQPTIDAVAAENLRQQMLAQHDQASRRMLQMKLDVSNVLTPDQRKTLATKMAQREALMERQRAERAALDK